MKHSPVTLALLGAISLGALGTLSLGSIAAAQSSAPSGPARPAAAPAATDPASAPSGNYAVDPAHTSVIARVAHNGGVSWSTFRFGTVAGTLDWNAADPTKSSLSVNVDIKSVASPVAGFADQLAGDHFLKAAQFPQATFVSTKIVRTGDKTGRIDGNLTFLGVTKPASIAATFVGTAKTMRGAPSIGFTGKLDFKRSDFGFTALQGVVGDDIEMVLDVELDKTA